jgi:hypothetical protein
MAHVLALLALAILLGAGVAMLGAAAIAIWRGRRPASATVAAGRMIGLRPSSCPVAGLGLRERTQPPARRGTARRERRSGETRSGPAPSRA